MNPAILGTLIGAVPGTAAAALATWASVRSSKLALEQAQLAWTTEHANWLRDKRSDPYVEGIRSLHEASVLRARLIKPETECSLPREEVPRILQSLVNQPGTARTTRTGGRANGSVLAEAIRNISGCMIDSCSIPTSRYIITEMPGQGKRLAFPREVVHDCGDAERERYELTEGQANE